MSAELFTVVWCEFGKLVYRQFNTEQEAREFSTLLDSLEWEESCEVSYEGILRSFEPTVVV
jgi:hypothetical protein